MKVGDFIRLEVQHQGFDLATHRGQLRVEWMQEAWDYATIWADRKPRIGDLRQVGYYVEPGLNFQFRTVDVRVGDRRCPSYLLVQDMIKNLWIDMDNLGPLEFYYRLEIAHPFVDGNGRAGKVLLHWLAKTLNDPEMPPDLFGNGLV